MKLRLLSLLALAGLFGCEREVTHPNDIPNDVKTGGVAVYLAPDGDDGTLNASVDEVWLRFEDVLIHHDTKGWITVGHDREDIDLMTLRAGNRVQIGAGQVYEGVYDALQVFVTDSWIVVNGQEKDLTIDSGFELPGEAIDFTGAFFVAGNTTTSLLLPWDLDVLLTEDTGDWTLRTHSYFNVEIDVD